MIEIEMFSKTGWNWTVFFCCVLFIFLSSQTFATVSEHLNQIQSNPRALYTFFKEMPKGGELHYHFSGSVDAEVMLSLAKQEKFCLDPKTFIMSHYLSECHGITAKQLASTPALYEQTVQAWSMKHFIPEKESAHDHFFNVFAKIDAVVHQHPEQLLATIMQKAADQKELYLEIIFFNLDNASHFTNQIENAKKFSDKRRILLADKRFQSTVNQSVLESKRWLAGARNRLNCGTSPAKSVCNLTVKFQYFIKRSEPLSQIFTQALAAFEAASKSKEIVGINLVQAEDGATSLHDYDAQMQIIQFLHNVYPQVHIALHAGELTPSLTSLKNLRFHIRHAVRLGHAERIGHGVDIAYENDHTILLDEMAKKSIAVEINLSSNRAILNVHRFDATVCRCGTYLPFTLCHD
jgi:adenosine deaminase